MNAVENKLSLCLSQSQDAGAVCGDSEPAEGSTAADRPDTRLCCPLQSAQGTTPVSMRPDTTQMSDSECVCAC